MMVHNAWTSYQERPLGLLSFRRDIVCIYLMRHSQPAEPGRPGRPQPLSQRVPMDVQFDQQSLLC